MTLVCTSSISLECRDTRLPGSRGASNRFTRRINMALNPRSFEPCNFLHSPSTRYSISTS